MFPPSATRHDVPVSGRRPAMRVRHLRVAREAAGAYGALDLRGPIARMEAALDELAAADLDALDEPSLRDALARVQRHVRRAEAQVTTLVSQLSGRRARRIDPERPDSQRARQQAERDVQRELADTLHLTPAGAKDAVAAGGVLAELSGPTRKAFAGGELTARHLRTMADTLRALTGTVDVDRLEADLLAAGRGQDAVTFGRTCRDRVAREDAEQARRDLRRIRARRYGSVTTDAAGMVHLRAGFVGAEAEVVLTAIETFRGPDDPDELRRPEQRTSDAVFEALRHALRHAESTDHGNRPHVFVHVRAEELEDPARAVVETTFAGALPLTEIAPIVADSVVTRIVRDAEGQVIDVGRATRTVTSGIWRGLVARDRGCTLCGAPPQRCQAAHLDRRWNQQAGTSVAEQGLLCWSCHRHVDSLRLVGRLRDGTVAWHHPDGRPYERWRRPA